MANPTPLRILHLEDSATDGELIGHLLAEEGISCDMVRRQTRTDFLQALEHKQFDLIIADCSLPGFSGLSALELAHKHAPEIPFIFVSGTIGEETAIESLRNGATDYVLKDRLSRLAPAVRRALAEASERAKNLEMEDRLLQAQRLEAVGTLAGGIAHDFNNILTIIKAHASLLPMESRRPDRVEEIGATIDRAAQRGSELVGQLLAFARKSDGSFTTTHINLRIQEIVAMLKEAFPRNIVFDLQLEEELPAVLADPGQVERVLVNLATNARDAMPQGGTLTLSTSRVRGDLLPLKTVDAGKADYLRLCVRDTGVGMDEATRQHIFEPFFTTKEMGKGTGLGLPVVYGLMKSHNGIIDVQSKLGEGTAISLFFPVPANLATRSIPKIVETPRAVGGTETVLIVDDEADVLYFLEIILQANGYQVLSSHSAEEALALLEGHAGSIDLLFSDLGLPKLDGISLGAKAKQLRPGIKVALSSGYTDGSIKTRMSEMGIDGFISKPYDSLALLQTLRTILDKKPA